MTSSSRSPSTRAICPRSGKLPCACDHTVSFPPSNTAAAHDGPIDACARYGREYVASSRFAAAAPATPLVKTVFVAVGSRGSSSRISTGSGSAGLSSQRAAPRAASSALTACSSRSAQTPTKLPFLTTDTTPGKPRTASASNATNRAEYVGGRSTRACTIPGSSMSWTYAAPVNFAGRSRRGTLFPMIE